MNKFYLLRHGQSIANIEKIIASKSVNAIGNYGLSNAGKEEVKQSVLAAIKCGWLSTDDTLVITSPFLRAVESAMILKSQHNCVVREDIRIVERGFGSLELKSTRHYEKVWTLDKENPFHTEWGVESIVAVSERALSLINELDIMENDKDIVVCTHGDVASALTSILFDKNLGNHRETCALSTGELVYVDRRSHNIVRLNVNEMKP